MLYQIQDSISELKEQISKKDTETIHHRHADRLCLQTIGRRPSEHIGNKHGMRIRIGCTFQPVFQRSNGSYSD